MAGQWTQTLNDVSRSQVAAGLDSVRKSGRAWPPTAPEFREICLMAGVGGVKGVDEARAEMDRYIRRQSSDVWSLSPEVYHTIQQNLDFYNYRQMSYEEAARAFNSAYRATLAQIKAGEALVAPPPKETLLEEKSAVPRRPLTEEEKAEQHQIASESMAKIKAMFKS